MLGVTGVFEEPLEDEVTNQAVPKNKDIDAPFPLDVARYPTGLLAKKFSALLAQFPLTEIKGGNVLVAHLGLLHLLSHLMSSEPAASLCIHVPTSTFQPNCFWEHGEDLEVAHNGEDWRFYWNSPSYTWMALSSPEDFFLAKTLPKTPEGTSWELDLSVDGLREKMHRYAGTYQKGCWSVEQSYPAISAVQLSGAVALMECVSDNRPPLPLFNDDEARALRRNVLRAHDEPARIRNGKIQKWPGTEKTIVQTLLFERYRDNGPWDVRVANDLYEKSWQEFAELIDVDDFEETDDNLDAIVSGHEESHEIGDLKGAFNQMKAMHNAMEENKAVPHRNKVAYKGITGAFCEADLTELPEVTPSRLAKFDADMQSLGLSAVGDFVSDANKRHSIARCYAGNQHAVAIISHRKENNKIGWMSEGREIFSVDFSNGTVEFQTDFEDGSCLTTSSIDAAHSIPERGICIRSYEDLSILELWKKHQAGILCFQKHRQTQPVDHLQLRDHSAFLARIDKLFGKLLGI
jgi:hypothetical protein